ncbi:MAG: phosphate/phosphite/phosphonate ABC transporter substrate-binding protein [Myxococcales bacterium]|nr:phosphate/phosphite/phosphonate ABC transporter substrate-binding protein [Myxococcales bacterium]
MSLSRRSFLLTLGVAAIAACKRDAVAGRSRPLVIALGPAYAPKSAEALRAAWASASGLTLELRVLPSATAVIDALQGGRADAGLLSLIDYLYCHDVLGAEPIAQVVRGQGRATQSGELVVQASFDGAALASLAGKRVGFVDQLSTTGFLLPAARLREAKVAFEPVWLGSHDAVLAAVESGSVAAGATYAGHASGRPPLRVLAETGSIANEPVFVASTVPADVRAALAKGLTAAAPPGALDGVADVTGFRAADSKDYATASDRVRAAGREVEDLVPGGWRRANEQRRPMWSYGQ